jgi:hypothetical protein
MPYMCLKQLPAISPGYPERKIFTRMQLMELDASLNIQTVWYESPYRTIQFLSLKNSRAHSVRKVGPEGLSRL